MKLVSLFALLIMGGFTSLLTAGPEIYDPLDAYKKSNTLSSKPQSEIVTQGTTVESARFKYDAGLLARVDYLDSKKNLTGYSLFDYDKGILVRERLFHIGDILVEDIKYEYHKNKLVKSLAHDIRGNALIEWRYVYDKEGQLVGGKRFLAKHLTESFRVTKNANGTTQHIYNARGELTSKVESVYKDGLLMHRLKTGLVGARYADYRYNTSKELVEIIYHETVRGEKKWVKTHRFEYSMAANVPTRSAFKTGS
ncbi:MAG TPA: hypothetical protein PLY93_13580 [Turneriella sp.]|nr:hypothetical protein [Turneriella sp.]